MHTQSKKSLFVFLLGLLLCLSGSFTAAVAEVYEPIAVYLTWDNDPTTSMVIHWISEGENSADLIEFQEHDQSSWNRMEGYHLEWPSNKNHLIHHVSLSHLRPETEYFFKVGENGKIYKFRTMPATLNEPVVFAVGGDVYHDEIKYTEQTNRQAAKMDPMFVIQGGDLAYAGEKSAKDHEKAYRWLKWLETWTQTMIRSDGCLIPMVPVVGNHDVNGRHNQTPAQALTFYALFPCPNQQAYHVLDFGNYLSLFVLDSGHSHPIKGEQAEWLERALSTRCHAYTKFAAYHVPAYPSVRKFNNKYSPLVREHWVPIFEKYGLHAAFEHHDHAYKRTLPIYQGEVDYQRGVLYMGDGAWGVEHPRTPKSPKKTWYLAKTQAARHCIVVTLTPQYRHYMAIDHTGQPFDQVLQLTELQRMK